MSDISAERQTHLKQLEAESIHITREVAAEFRNPVMMYSIGKDSSVMLHLARKAFILPFRSDRDFARALSSEGDFIEVHVDTPLNVCEQRDPKGLYQKAREGKIKDFTGINSPYEVPKAAEVTVNTAELRQQEIVGLLLKQLK